MTERPVASYPSAAEVTRLSPASAARLQELAQELLGQADAVADLVNRRAIEAEPGLADPDDPTSLEALLHSSRANVGAILAMLTYGVPGTATEPTSGSLELFERLAEDEDGLITIMRGYRIGLAELWQIWAAHLASRVDDPHELHELLAASTSEMFHFIDRMLVQLVERWPDARRRHKSGLTVSTEELVRTALFGPTQDARNAMAALGYAPGTLHVAISLPHEADGLISRLRTFTSARTVSLRTDANLVLWLSTSTPLDSSLLRAALPEDATVGTSESHPGLEGFRTAYREALDAQRIAELRGDVGPVRYRDVALLALLCADPVRARALANTELGPLASDDEGAIRLRETLAAYLECGESHTAAAQKLFVHPKTVRYRVRKAEATLGYRVADRRSELEAALLLYRAFGLGA
jgi:DNA-binding PucR family transcriptional regulator